MRNPLAASQKLRIASSNPSIPILAGIVALALVIVYLVSDSYIQRIDILLGITIIFIVSLNLSNGFTGVFSLGHVGFMGIGAYAAAILTLPIQQKLTNLHLPAWLNSIAMPFLPATLIGGIIASLVALFVGFSLMRLTGPYVALGTEGFLVIVQVILLNWQDVTRGARTFSGVPAYTNLWWVVGWMLVTIYVTWRIVNSNFGRQMKAVRDNEIAAQSLGINILRSRLLAYCVSAFFSAVSGALWAHFILAFSPASFYFVTTFTYLTMLVVGGMGSFTGAMAGAILVLPLNEVLRNLEGGLSLGFINIPPVYGAAQILMAVAFAIVIIRRPEGIMGGKEIDFTQLSTWFSKMTKKRGETGKIDKIKP